MTADVSIIVAIARNVLELPNAAITTVGTTSTVQLVQGSSTVTTDVTIGLVGESDTADHERPDGRGQGAGGERDLDGRNRHLRRQRARASADRWRRLRRRWRRRRRRVSGAVDVTSVRARVT